MKKDFKPNTGKDGKRFESLCVQAFEKAKNQEEIVKRIKDVLHEYLIAASELEHLLSMQYLFAAFSLKKYPEEFADYDANNSRNSEINNLRLRQIEVIRRWEAKILYVSRQEMEHLNLVQNLLAILGEDPFLFRPNYPVSPSENALDEPINLMRFSKETVEIFRYWEKPDHLNLDNPFTKGKTTKKLAPFNIDKTLESAWAKLLAIITGNEHDLLKPDTIEETYTYINTFFYFLLTYKLIEGSNIDRIVEEHFGFNITLDPIVEGKYFDYVNDVITQILEEGEGVWGVPPPLDSHFMVFQQMLEEYEEEFHHSKGNFDPALPVVSNPTVSRRQEFFTTSLKRNAKDANVNPVTNKAGKKAMKLFNQAYNVLNQMLYGFFSTYSIDYTTGIRPPEPNAFFRTSFYPFMTMVIRPLGEMVSRLPASKDFVPNGREVPPETAGPNFFYAINQERNKKDIDKHFKKVQKQKYFIKMFNKMAEEAMELSIYCKENGYHMANYQEPDARDFDERFKYLSENLLRIAQNFECYWSGEIIAPISSKNFQNFSNSFN